MGKTALTTAEFISKAQAVHGLGTYNYSKVTYTVSYAKLTIVCPQCGPFQQSANKHMLGRGCPECKRKGAQKRGALLSSIAATQFVEKARARHGKNYDYSTTTYRGGHTKLSIICPEHGHFQQTASSHLAGNGCPICGRARTNAAKILHWAEQANGRMAVLYFLRLTGHGEDFYKLGITYNTLTERYRKLRQQGYSYEIIAQHHSTNATRIYDWEQSILETFAHLRYHPKRQFGGASECFSEADEILAVFPV